MQKYVKTMFLTTSLLGIASCKVAAPDISDEAATTRGQRGQSQRCQSILPSVEKAALASLGKMVAYKGSHSMASSVSKKTVTMLNNMMRHPSKPIHPIAFYATVKDFESSGDLTWAKKSGNGLYYFKTPHCTSGECFGLFQVDVRLEPAWKGGAFCQGPGLNLWSTTAGGADFCAAQFWWTMANGGQKCSALAGFAANPCTDRNYTWTTKEVRKGPKAYVQAIQSSAGWKDDAWEEMYKNYERCYTDKMPLLKAIAKFKVDVGLEIPAPPQIEEEKLESETPAVGEPVITNPPPLPPVNNRP